MRSARSLSSLVALLCSAPLSSVGAQQQHAAVDSLVAQITRDWGLAPRGGWCVQWQVVRGDTSALRTTGAEITGSDRLGSYTITIRPTAFAAPTMVGRLRIGHERAETVTAHPIARGAHFTEDDLLIKHQLVWGAPDGSAPLSINALVGTEARRTLRDGETLRLNDVAAIPVVHAGDQVTAEIVRDGVRLALAGTALQSASLGGRVAIRLDRGRRFAGIATGRNTVRLD
jgi:flagella basal body P-ring formation protein FlgA